jgi:hypothetical protein
MLGLLLTHLQSPAPLAQRWKLGAWREVDRRAAATVMPSIFTGAAGKQGPSATTFTELVDRP